jgi:hypothetical protein
VGLPGLIPYPLNSTYSEQKEEKTKQKNTMKTNSKRSRTYAWPRGLLFRLAGLRITINALRQNKIALIAIQETRWTKLTPQVFASEGCNVYTSSLTTKHEFGTAVSR